MMSSMTSAAASSDSGAGPLKRSLSGILRGCVQKGRFGSDPRSEYNDPVGQRDRCRLAVFRRVTCVRLAGRDRCPLRHGTLVRGEVGEGLCPVVEHADPAVALVVDDDEVAGRPGLMEEPRAVEGAAEVQPSLD